MADKPTTAARYMMETTSQVSARVCRPDGTSIGVIDVEKAAAYRDELNRLLGQLDEARAEAERLRGVLRPIAETFADVIVDVDRNPLSNAIGQCTEHDPCITVWQLREIAVAVGVMPDALKVLPGGGVVPAC